MAESASVLVRGLWEGFPVSQRSGGVKEVLSRPWLGRRRGTAWALRDVSFEVRPGEIVGLVGANGSGKSTLLRCVAGVLPPTRGEVLVRGRAVGLLELDRSFHGELTGRENAVVAGALLGISRKELLHRLRDVAGFADLDGALDRELRTYSSGERVRLAFALGLELRPDLLLIDEYLAGADEAFRSRCSARLMELRAQGASAIVVSHERSLVEALCDRCLLLEVGRLAAEGQPREVLDAYLGDEDPRAVSA